MTKATESRITRRPKKTCTQEDLAAMTFKPWPEAVAAIGTPAEWMQRARDTYNPLRISLEALAFDDVALTERMRAGDAFEAMMASADWLGAQANAYEALAKFCRTAQLRILAVGARLAIAGGENAP